MKRGWELAPDASQVTRPGVWRDVTAMQWNEFQPFAAIICVPAIVVLIIIGLAYGSMTTALAASTGALVVGYGAFKKEFRDPVVPMVLVACGMSISAGIGTPAHTLVSLDVACVALWGFGLGLMNLIGRAPGWLALQGSIALVIASAFPATPLYAAWRVLLALAGGVIQLAVVLSVRWAAPARLFEPFENASFTAGNVLARVHAMLVRRVPGLGHAITMAMAVGFAELLFRLLDIPNGYWVPMTVLLILRPAVRETAPAYRDVLRRRVADAAYGDIAPSSPRTDCTGCRDRLDLLRIPTGELCNSKFAILSFAVTVYVVLLFAIAGLPEPTVAFHRAVATLLGGMIALAAPLVANQATRTWGRLFS